MNSIPVALTWELLKRSRMAVLLSFAGSCLLASIVVYALLSQGGLDSADPSFVAIKFSMVLLSMMSAGISIISAQTEISRIQLLPISTWTLVNWRLIPGMILISAAVALNAVVLNLVFAVQWPLIWPALVAPAGLVMFQSATWTSEKPVVQVACNLVAGGIIGSWYTWRHHTVFAEPLTLAQTLLEAIPLVVMAGVAHRVAILGITKRRCGESLVTGRAWDLFETDLAPLMAHRWFHGNFKTSREAQFWFEWRKRGWLVPLAATCCFAIGLFVWLVFDRSLFQLTFGMLFAGALLAVSGMVGGLVIGNLGVSDSNVEIGHFLSTRPMTNRDYSRIVLKVVAVTVAVCWGIWLGLCGVISAIALSLGQGEALWNSFLKEWWYIPAVLVVNWTVTGVIASLYLTGRPLFMTQIIIGGLCVYFGVMVSALALDRESKAALFQATQLVSGLAMILVTIICVTIARRRNLISNSEVLLGVGAWLLLSAIAVYEVLQKPSASVSMSVVMAGLAAQSLLPFAAAPLAIGWNRNR